MKRLLIAITLFIALPASQAATVGGKVHKDGTEIQCDLPGAFHKANINSKGLGCCVFRSIDHTSHHQQIPALHGFPEWMLDHGIPGGGYPSKVDALIKQICKDRGYPIPDYIQVQGPWEKVKDVITLACQTGRMVCITYCRSPTPGRYKGSISHMVNMVHADGKHYVYLDNNFVKPMENAYQWCAENEAEWASACGGQVWAVIFLDYGPPPSPKINEEYQ